MSNTERVLETQTFIGSSSEGLIVANAIKANLADITECQIWTEGVFLPGRTFIETLEAMLDRVDYAILVATPDDMLTKRDIENFSMRDNVLLELGLFMAKLGRTRTYLVSPQDKPIHIPSDLLGVTTVSYPTPASAEQALEALSAPCDKIKHAMHEAQKDLSLAMKRIIVKRLLTLTNRVQAFLVTLQSESLRSLMDRSEFKRIQTKSVDQIVRLAEEYVDDADKLGVREEADSVTRTIVTALEALPFPEETVVSEGDVIGGVLSHFTGGRSAKNQVSDRFTKLMARYEQWWNKHGPRISGALNGFQGALIAHM